MPYFANQDGAIELTNGEFVLDFTAAKEISCFYVAAYNEQGEAVAGTGTVQIEVSGIPGQWHSVAGQGDSLIDLATAGESATYNVPVFLGCVDQARATITGFSGADHVKVRAWRK